MRTRPQHYLTLKLMRLRRSEDWGPTAEGLSFVLVKGGRGSYSAGTNVRSLNCGDVLVVNPALAGKVLAHNGEIVFWEFSVRLEQLFPLFDANEVSLLRSLAEGLRHSRFYSSGSPVAKECHTLVESAPPQGNCTHRSQMLRVAASILSAEFADARNQRPDLRRGAYHTLNVFESLTTDDLLTLSVGDLAVKFGCSRRHLNRLFRQHFGSSVAALRMEMRLLKAVTLLSDPDIKVITVAEECGFNHLGLFNTCFKRRFGSSPGQWRKSTIYVLNPTARKIENKGVRPVSGDPQVVPHRSVASCVEKVLDGKEILDELKRRDLIFRAKSPQNPKPISQTATPYP